MVHLFRNILLNEIKPNLKRTKFVILFCRNVMKKLITVCRGVIVRNLKLLGGVAVSLST